MTLDYAEYRGKLRSATETKSAIIDEETRQKQEELTHIIDMINSQTESMDFDKGNIVCRTEFPRYLTIDDLVEVFGKQGYYLYYTTYFGCVPYQRHLCIGTEPTLLKNSLTQEQLAKIVRIERENSSEPVLRIDYKSMNDIDVDNMISMLNNVEGIDVRHATNCLNIWFLQKES